MAKVVGFTALLYGKDYLAWAIRSIIDHVDEHHIAYSPIGAHGHRTDIPCPETRDELYAIAAAAAGSKLRWHDGEWPYEGAQRDSIHEYAPDADVILVLDSDEIWGDGLAELAVREALSDGTRRWRMPIIHYWRSFYRCVLHDPAYPIRVIVPNTHYDITDTMTTGDHWGDPYEAMGERFINHMGYAQRPEIVRYKLETHGHKNEFRRDCDWFADKFMANAQEDCHPVGSEFWWPERVDPLDYMPRWMQDHPYYHMQVIE